MFKRRGWYAYRNLGIKLNGLFFSHIFDNVLEGKLHKHSNTVPVIFYLGIYSLRILFSSDICRIFYKKKN